MIRVGVGTSSNRIPQQAARAAAQAAFKQAEIKDCDMVLLFATASYEPRELLGAVREATGRVRLVGCTVRSLAAGKQAQDASHAIAVVTFKSDELRWRTAGAEGAPEGWRAAGASLGRALEGSARDARALWLFTDGLSLDWPELRAGLAGSLADRDGCPLLGIAAADGVEMKRTFQFNGDEVLTGGAVAALMLGGGAVSTASEPFGRTVGLAMTATKVRGERLLELDGRPALSLLREFVGAELLDRPAAALPWFALQLHVPGEGDRPGSDVLRLIRDTDPESGSFRVSSELRADMRVRFVLRDRDRLMAAPGRLGARVSPGAPPHFALYGGCAVARSGLVLGDDRMDLATELQRVATANVPWLALNGYGVFCPSGQRDELHGHSMALTVLR
jgi:hypothetical protein